MHLSKLDDLEPFTTLDGSTIREIAGPAWTPARNQIAGRGHRARRRADGRALPPRHRGALLLHRGPRAHDARRRRARRRRRATASSSRPAQVHGLVNTGDEPLVLLCCCAPRLLARGHRPGERSGSRRVGPAVRHADAASSTLLVVLLAALCAASGASALTIGIADQKPDMFTDPRFLASDLHYARRAVAVGRADEPHADGRARRVARGRARRAASTRCSPSRTRARTAASCRRPSACSTSSAASARATRG